MQWNAFHFKLLAALTMVSDHMGKLFFPNELIYRFIGRVSFPLFAWMIANGYRHTRNVKHYLIRIFIFALISQIPYTLVIKGFSYDPLHYVSELNVLFTFFFGLLALICLDKIPQLYLAWCAVLLIAAISELLKTDYGLIGVLSVAVFHYFRDQYEKMLICQCLLFFLMYSLLFVDTPDLLVLIPLFLFMIFTIFPFLLIMLYNGKPGLKMKYFFYVFYPGHFLILYSIQQFLISSS